VCPDEDKHCQLWTHALCVTVDLDHRVDDCEPTRNPVRSREAPVNGGEGKIDIEEVGDETEAQEYGYVFPGWFGRGRKRKRKRQIQLRAQ
jgi:hypothetical protein